MTIVQPPRLGGRRDLKDKTADLMADDWRGQALCAGDQIHVETANHHYVCLHVIETHPWDFRKDCTGAPT